MTTVETSMSRASRISAAVETSAGAMVARPAMDWIRLMGIPVSRVTEQEAVERLQEFVRSGEPHLIVTADSFAMVTAAEDAEFRGILEGAAMVTPDSTGILWAARRLGTPLPERVSGVDIAERLCELAAIHGYSIFLYGGAPG